MINYGAYRKFVSLKNGHKVMFRLLTEADREGLIQLFQEAPEEDLRFLKQDVRDEQLINSWLDQAGCAGATWGWPAGNAPWSAVWCASIT